LSLDAAVKDRLVRSQYGAMTSSRLQCFPNCSRDVIVVGSAAAGFLSVDRNERRVRIVDIALLPQFRNQGLGGALLRQILAEADECRIAVDLRVERNNPARRLYERLGFTSVADDGVYITMERWRMAEKT
jgi:ribosomal protein S18 acetylase RimI-like enzyme